MSGEISRDSLPNHLPPLAPWNDAFPTDPTDSISFREQMIKVNNSLPPVVQEVDEEEEGPDRGPQNWEGGAGGGGGGAGGSREQVSQYGSFKSRGVTSYFDCRSCTHALGENACRDDLCGGCPSSAWKNQRRLLAQNRRISSPKAARTTTSLIQYLHSQKGRLTNSSNPNVAPHL